MEKIRSHFSKIRVPKGGDRVYKDECLYSFASPESETGLYVCLNTFLGWSREHVEKYSQKTGNCVFLHIKRIKKELPPEKETEPEKKIAKLAIGMEGGFNPDAGKKKYEYEEHNSIVVLPDFDKFPLPNPELPELIQQSVEGIIKADSALHLAEAAAAAGAWDGEVRVVSKHADSLQQLDNGIKVPPNGWKCRDCDKTDNLWLNLTDGTILCGRRQLDGSGGNNHAVEYYDKTKYPLAVKLGTITQDGKADVYSYDEDDMVLNPNLVKHLAHFGINVSKMEKTEKTMLELEIDYNQRAWEWSRITESGAKLVPKFGPGYTGLKNLGNSCYVNSVMQVLFTVPSFVQRYLREGPSILDNYTGALAAEDFNVQMAKFADGLLSGKYSPAPLETKETEDQDDLQPGISPLMFRTLVGRGHAEFSTKKQQDAMEFFEHILKLTSQNSAGIVDPGNVFRFEVEDKFICSASAKVRYVTRPDQYLPLPVPMEEASNKEEVAAYQQRKAQASQTGGKPEEVVRAKISFESCLSKFVAAEEIDAFSSAAGKNVPMQKITRLRTFPDYLVIQLVKFGIGQDWVPMKFDVSIDMPEELDLSVLLGTGKQEGEEELPEAAVETPKEPEIDVAVVQQLTEMGFPWEACRKAVHFTGNSGCESAMAWVMEHMGDADFAEPLQLPNKSTTNDKFTPNEDGLGMIMSMGFTRDQATLALKETNNNLERAADWIFSHQHELDALLAAQSGGSADVPTQQPTEPRYTNGDPKYQLQGFISHMGTSIFVGHYVCHIKKDGEWTIFNDNKVSKSADPPKDLGYVYLYKRV